MLLLMLLMLMPLLSLLLARERRRLAQPGAPPKTRLAEVAVLWPALEVALVLVQVAEAVAEAPHLWVLTVAEVAEEGPQQIHFLFLDLQHFHWRLEQRQVSCQQLFS